MKTKFFFSLVAIIFCILAVSSVSYGQGILWYDPDDAVILSDSDPGDTTAVTLNFILGSGAELTNTQTITFDLSSFQVDPVEVLQQSNYEWSSVRTSAGDTINMDSDTTDYTVSFVESTGYLTFTLATENSLIPDDTVHLYISSDVLRNKGEQRADAIDDITLQVKSSDQVVFSAESETDDLSDPKSADAIYMVAADSLGGNWTYWTFKDTTRGRLPKDGKISVSFPDGFIIGTVDTSRVIVTDNTEGTKLLLASAVKGSTGSADSNDVLITLAETSYIDNLHELEIQIGKPGYEIVQNKMIYEGKEEDSNDQRVTFTTGIMATGDIFITGYDSDTNPIFTDSVSVSTGASEVIASNYFPPNNDGIGGVNISDATAGNPTDLTIRFQLGQRVDSVTVGSTKIQDTLYLDISDFTPIRSLISKDSLYVFSTGAVNFTDTSKYTVDTTNLETGIVAIVPDDNDIYLLAANTITLKLDDILKNKGSTDDINVGIRTNHMEQWVFDRDTTRILPNAGGLITYCVLSDTNAYMPSTLDSMIFRADAEIPKDGKISVMMPGTFTVHTDIDSALVDTSGDGITWAKAGDAVDGGVSNIDVNGTTITLTLNLGEPIEVGDYVRIAIGDTAIRKENKLDWAFTNPSICDTGTYPGNGRGGIYVETMDNDGNVFMQGNNSDTVEIVSNAFVDSQFTFASINDMANSTLHIWNAVGACTTLAGDSIKAVLHFTLGSELTGWPTNVGADTVSDTLYVDLSDFGVDPNSITDTNMVKFELGENLSSGRAAATSDWDSLLEYNATTKVLSIIHYRNNDKLKAKS